MVGVSHPIPLPLFAHIHQYTSQTFNSLAKFDRVSDLLVEFDRISEPRAIFDEGENRSTERPFGTGLHQGIEERGFFADDVDSFHFTVGCDDHGNGHVTF